MLLDYCPFCGEKLYDLRINNTQADELIKNAIQKWRDGAECKLDNNESYTEQMTFYGVNTYDSFNFIANKLSEKYAGFNDKYGVDEDGVLRKNATFITVPKLFALAQNHDLLRYYDPYTDLIDKEQIPEYFIEKFQKKINFPDEDIRELSNLLNDIFWDMYHTPQYFDELRGIKR